MPSLLIEEGPANTNTNINVRNIHPDHQINKSGPEPAEQTERQRERTR